MINNAMRTRTTFTRAACTVAVLLLVLLTAVACASDASGDRMMGNSASDMSKDEDYFGEAEDFTGIGNGASAPPSEEIAKGETDASDEEYATKIIRTVTMRAQTKAFDTAVTALESMVVDCGGYVESSYIYGAGYDASARTSRSAEYVFRVPAEQLDAFLEGAGELCVIVSNNSSANNVTSTYYDIVARLETLRAKQESLMSMLEKAEDINTMLTIEDHLYQVIYEIESYETQLRLLDSRVAYSTVSLTLSEMVEYTEVGEQSWGERLGDAFRDSWVAFGKGFQSFTVFLVAAFPTLLVLGAIAALVIVIVVKTNQKHRRKTQKPKDGE